MNICRIDEMLIQTYDLPRTLLFIACFFPGYEHSQYLLKLVTVQTIRMQTRKHSTPSRMTFANLFGIIKEHQNSSIYQRQFTSIQISIQFINYLSNFQVMKLLVNYKQTAKEANSISTLAELIKFVTAEFHIIKDSVHLYYVDDDQDNITIAEEEDLEIMQAVNQDKQIIKIFVEGNVEERTEPARIAQQKIQPPFQTGKDKQQVPEILEEVNCKQEERPKIEEPKVEPRVALEEPKEARDEHEQRHHHWRKKKWEKMEQFMNQTVARLVDERIKALMPCIREQLAHPQPIIQQVITHQGYECKSCLKNPIIGIRYQCPSCPMFNLCQNCQQTIDHQHNLLKVKKIIEKKDQEEQSRFKHCFKDIFKKRGHHGHHGHGHHRSSSSDKQRTCPRRGRWDCKSKLAGLCFIFGGESEQYQTFVQQNQHLRPRQLFKRYASLNDLPEEEFRKRFIGWRCFKLSECFGKPAESYTSFVEEHYNLRYHELIDLLHEQGIEKREDRKEGWWGLRRHEFRKDRSGELRKKSYREKHQSEVQIKEVVKVQEQPKEEKKKEREVPKEATQNSTITNPSLLPLLNKESTETLRQKGELLIEMKEIFGMDRSKEYYKFIEANFHLGKEKVLELWIDNLSH